MQKHDLSECYQFCKEYFIFQKPESSQTNPALTIHVSTFVASSLLSFLRWNTLNVLFHKYEQILTKLMKETVVERPARSGNVEDFSASQTGWFSLRGGVSQGRLQSVIYVLCEASGNILQDSSVELDVNRMYLLLNVETKCYFCMTWNAVSVENN